MFLSELGCPTSAYRGNKTKLIVLASSLYVKTTTLNWDKPLAQQGNLVQRWVLYKPDLTGYRQLLRNYWVQRRNSIGVSNQMIVGLNCWLDFGERFLVLYMHTALHNEYALAGAPTDSYRKVVSHIDVNSPYPRWLFDICREVARPQYHNGTAYLPWRDVDFNGSFGAISGFGLDPGLACSVSTIMSLLDADSRLIAEEELKPTPVLLIDGELVMCDIDLIADWRLNSAMALRTFRHGCKVYDTSGAYQGEGCTLRKSFRGIGLQFEQKSWQTLTPAEQAEPLLDSWDVGPAIDLLPQPVLPAVVAGAAAPVNPLPDVLLALLKAIGSGSYFLDPLFALHDQLRFVCYWNEDRAQTTQMVSSWLLRRTKQVQTLPPPVTADSVIHFGVEYSRRFPTDSTHSSTPKRPGEGAGQRTVKSKSKKSNQSRAPSAGATFSGFPAAAAAASDIEEKL